MRQEALRAAASQTLILWVDTDRTDYDRFVEGYAKSEKSEGLPFHKIIEFVSAPSLATKRISETQFSVIIAGQALGEMTGVRFLQEAKSLSPLSTRILTTSMRAQSVLEEAVNSAGVFSILAKPFELEMAVAQFNRAISEYEKIYSRSFLMKEVSQQNKKLEELTTGLENLVEDRTKHIEDSKNQVERNLAEMRRLVLFIKDLSGLTVLDELLPLLRKEIRKFHHVQKPILCYPSLGGKMKVLYFRSSDVTEKEVTKAWPSSSRLRVNQPEDSEYLANIFSRPFAKVIAVPLGLQGLYGDQREIPSVVYIEHDLSEEKIDYFIRFMSQRLQPISIAVDRVILEYQAKFVSYQWESTFDGIQTPIAIIDSEKKLLRSNRSFGEGYRGDACHSIFANSKTTCVDCPVSKAVSSLRPTASRVHARGKIYEVYSYPIYLQGADQVTNVINHYVDITASRQLYSKVVQTEKLAAIGLLAGNIAHELNNPLTGIRSLVQVLSSELDQIEKKPETLHDDLVEVEKAAERSQVIIKNLLEFSSPESPDRLFEVSLNSIIERTMPLLKTSIHIHRTEIELTPKDVLVRVNVSLIQQVFFNLVTNASQAMLEPGTLSVSTERVELEGRSFVELKVSDTGKGISKEVLDHIFEPFFTTKKEGKGTGLGLSMSRTIIERHDGKIAVESELGNGTTFRVFIPRIEKKA